MSLLFEPISVGPYTLPNRIVMASMTRNRADVYGAPTELNATYYAQRASAGLIISEATYISPRASSSPSNPGIYTSRQIAGWRLVTKAVHDAGGKIFLQLWHVGRLSHPLNQPDEALPVAPSAIKPPGEGMTRFGRKPYVTPRTLGTAEIAEVVEEYRKAAENARDAGFDGVELHGANGFLIEQFLRESANRRTDRYGGSIQNRARFLLEVTEAVVGVWGEGRVGIHLSPNNSQKGLDDQDNRPGYAYVASELNHFGLAYLNFVERLPGDREPPWGYLLPASFRPIFHGRIIANSDYDKRRAEEALSQGTADLISFARLFISNPDLPERFRRNLPLNRVDKTTVYGGGSEGYTDYPSWREGDEQAVAVDERHEVETEHVGMRVDLDRVIRHLPKE